MGREEWFRRKTWTAEDTAEFQARLKRSRGEFKKAQYLRIQALHLAEAGNHGVALELLGQLLRDWPAESELASAHLQMAESYAAMGNDEAAIGSFRASLAAQEAYRGIRTNVALAFAWFIVMRRRDVLYDEVGPLLIKYEKDVGLMFPVQRFKCAVIRALLAWEWGYRDEAKRFADEAQRAADEGHSRLRYHAKLGLVDSIPAEVAQRLAVIGRV